ncbi:hypothetical protein N9V42_05800 [Flavobacteriaceae bacterium]|jgi:hypothetical protein|nr:hypothetical protein [Flavobacteriaceae bacterium]|tara:strand:- start:476 stop:607 length:132 start_codon:yes stop_codon:yes gene_type:complete
MKKEIPKKYRNQFSNWEDYKDWRTSIAREQLMGVYEKLKTIKR